MIWSQYTGIDLKRFCDVVKQAPSEAVVEAWVIEQTAALDKPALNAEMERMITAKIPDAWREHFGVVFDLLEADDTRVYAQIENRK